MRHARFLWSLAGSTGHSKAHRQAGRILLAPRLIGDVAASALSACHFLAELGDRHRRQHPARPALADQQKRIVDKMPAFPTLAFNMRVVLGLELGKVRVSTIRPIKAQDDAGVESAYILRRLAGSAPPIGAWNERPPRKLFVPNS